jgi:hypothetical protein
MLTIRQSQLDLLREQRSTEYEHAIMSHLKRCFPSKLRAIGEEHAKDLIRVGIDRARKHGFTTQRLVCKFIDLVFVFGVNFDADLDWASDALRQSELTAEERMESLISLATDYLDSRRIS